LPHSPSFDSSITRPIRRMSRAPRRSARDEIARISNAIVACERCPRLRAYCAEVALTKRRSFATEVYWGKPVPGFGDPAARIWILGLAPAAHGGNRTGRVFTGDRSGDFLYAALHRAGFANQPHSIARDDGLRLKEVFISAAARCAPPGNKPAPVELDNCSSYLDDEARALGDVRAIVCLGGIAWNAALLLCARRGAVVPRPRPRFAHAGVVELAGFVLIGCYHVSQQNTFTGRLTPKMLDAVLSLAALRAGTTRAPFSRGER
jgi:uracil-DNA glycosylase family 4